MFIMFSFMTFALPPLMSTILQRVSPLTTQQFQITKSFSLLLLGMILSALATLNFSLALLVGLLAAPLTYMRPCANRPVLLGLGTAVMVACAPTTVLAGGSWYWGSSVEQVLTEAAFGWGVWGMYSQVVVWCVWWPAWVISAVLLYGQPVDEACKTIEDHQGSVVELL